MTRTRASRWASATFTGARHEIALSGTDPCAARRWLASLPEAELPVRGHLVADLAVTESVVEGDGWTAAIEALTVEER